MASKDEDEKKKQDQANRPNLDLPGEGVGLAETAARAIEAARKKRSLQAIDDLIGG